MISKLSVGMLLTVAALLVSTPSNAVAADTKAQIKKFYNQLKALPNAGGPNSKVNSLVTKLVKLDPKKALKYFNTGLTKLSNAAGDAKSVATKMQLSVAKALKKSGLSTSQIDKLNKKINTAVLNYQPTPVS